MNKKITILLLVLIVILIGVVFLSFFEQGEREESPQTEIVFQSEGDAPMLLSSSSIPATQAGEIDLELFKASLDTYLLDETAIGTFRTFSSEGEKITLKQFLDAKDAKIDGRAGSLLDQGKWSLYKCEETANNSKSLQAITLSLSVALAPDYPGDLYSDLVKDLRISERDFVTNLSKIFYADDVVRTFGEFKSIDSLTRSVVVKNTYTNEESEFAYFLAGDELLFSNSATCLSEARSFVEDADG